MSTARGESYVISREGPVTRIDFFRPPDYKEMLDLLARLEATADSSLRLYVMIEAEILLSTAEVKEGAELARVTSNQPERIAIVAPGEITYSISRIFKVLRESSATKMEVFRDLDEARRWLLAD
jgi:hypothetical protein